jgi:error-prone DNA polymerase
MKGMRDEPLALWAAADERDARNLPEAFEPDVALKSMTAGREVVEDYTRIGLTLRDHPMSFLRNDLRARRIVTCAEAGGMPDGRWTFAAGLVLVRQRPGSAKGVMFATLEDESGVINIVVWPSLFEKQRSVVLGAGLLAVNGKIQREGDVVHLVAQRLFDLTSDLSSLSDRDGEAFALPHGRGDELRNGPPGPDSRSPKEPPMQARNIYVPDLHIDTIKIRSRNFH